MYVWFLTSEYVSEPASDGGLATYLCNTAHALEERGHRVRVLVSSDRDEALVHEGISVQRINVNHSTARVIRALLGPRNWEYFEWPLEALALGRGMRRLLISEPHPDVIQVASYRAVGLYRPRTIPTLCRLSSYLPLWEAAYGHRPSNRHRWKHRLEMSVAKRADQVYGPSERIAKEVAEALGTPVRVIRPYRVVSPIELSKLAESARASKDVVFFGTIGLLKGCAEISSIVRAFLKVETSLRLILIGKDTFPDGQQMVERIVAAARPYQDRVIHCGVLSRSEVSEAVSRARFIVLPSRIDNFPNAVAEAMALGKVVVGTSGTSLDELIVDGETGRTCRPQDPDSLLDAMLDCARMSAEELAQMGHAAHLRIQQLCGPNALDALEQAFSRAMNPH